MEPIDLRSMVALLRPYRFLIAGATVVAFTLGGLFSWLTIPRVYESGVRFGLEQASPQDGPHSEALRILSSGEGSALYATAATSNDMVQAYLLRLQDPSLQRQLLAGLGMRASDLPGGTLTDAVRVQAVSGEEVILLASGFSPHAADRVASFLATDFQSFVLMRSDEQIRSQLADKKAEIEQRVATEENRIQNLNAVAKQFSPSINLATSSTGADPSAREIVINPAYAAVLDEVGRRSGALAQDKYDLSRIDQLRYAAGHLGGTKAVVKDLQFHPLSPALKQRASRALSSALIGLTASVILAFGLASLQGLRSQKSVLKS